MSSRVRLLPALIGAAGVLFALRLGAMASGAEQVPPAEPVGAATPSATEANAAAVPPAGSASQSSASQSTGTAAAKTTPVPPSAPPPQAPAQTKGEAEVLQNLGQRRAALDARERDLALREQLLSATEKRMSEHLAELRGLEAKLGTMLAQREEAEETQLASLVKTYENMKASDAAKIFNKLDRQVMLDVAQRMKPAKIGAVLAAMDPARAQDLTVMLARRLSLPKPQPVAAAPMPEPVAPEPQPQAAAAPSEPPHS